MTTDIVTPDSDEWIRDGAPTPAFIQYLEQFKTWINERQAAINAESENPIVASLSASGAVGTPSDPWLDADGDSRADWNTNFVWMATGTATNAIIQEAGAMTMARVQTIYNRQVRIVARQNEIADALIEAGFMENV